MKLANIIVIFILLIISGCNQSDCTDSINRDIYNAINIFRAEFPLKSAYGLEETPLKDLEYQPQVSDSAFLQMHLLVDTNAKKNRNSGILGGVSICSCLTQEDISYMASQINKNDNFKWNSKCANLKNTNEYGEKYSLSIPLFSKDKTKFIMRIENYNAGGMIILYKKENNTWTSAIESHWIY